VKQLPVVYFMTLAIFPIFAGQSGEAIQTVPAQSCAPACPSNPSTAFLGTSQGSQPSVYDERVEELYREMLWRHLEDGQQPDIDKRREAEQQEREMLQKANKFVELWRSFVQELNDRGTFNVKIAKELSKSFRELEKIGAWPKVDRH